MGLKIGNMPARHIWDHRPVQYDHNLSISSTDSYVQSSGPHWLTRVPLLGKALPFLLLTACPGSSSSAEVKVGVGVAAAAGVVALYGFFNRRINNRRIAELPSPMQIMKYGVPHLRFSKKLNTAAKVISHYVGRGFPEEVARKIAYAWFSQHVMHQGGMRDLNQYDVRRTDLYGIVSSFSNPQDVQFDNEPPDVMDRVGCSASLGLMLTALDRGIRAVPELANVFLAFNLKVYQIEAGEHSNVLKHILNTFGNRPGEKYEVSERDVGRMLESSNRVFVSDNNIVDGVTHLLFGGMSLDAFEAGQYDRGLELGYVHVWRARKCFVNSSVLDGEKLSRYDSVRTVTEKYFETLRRRAEILGERFTPDVQYSSKPWSSSMLPATTAMLQSFAVEPV